MLMIHFMMSVMFLRHLFPYLFPAHWLCWHGDVLSELWFIAMATISTDGATAGWGVWHTMLHLYGCHSDVSYTHTQSVLCVPSSSLVTLLWIWVSGHEY